MQRGDNADSREQVPCECDQLERARRRVNNGGPKGKNNDTHRYHNENRGMGRT